eukprot:scaffold16150_cov46-Phaeocystis_antarctica.AAC.1
MREMWEVPSRRPPPLTTAVSRPSEGGNARLRSAARSLSLPLLRCSSGHRWRKPKPRGGRRRHLACSRCRHPRAALRGRGSIRVCVHAVHAHGHSWRRVSVAVALHGGSMADGGRCWGRGWHWWWRHTGGWLKEAELGHGTQPSVHLVRCEARAARTEERRHHHHPRAPRQQHRGGGEYAPRGDEAYRGHAAAQRRYTRQHRGRGQPRRHSDQRAARERRRAARRAPLPRAQLAAPLSRRLRRRRLLHRL